jgi:acetyl esterase/lipase
MAENLFEVKTMADRASRSSFTTMLSSLVSEGGLVVERDKAYGPHPRHTLDIYRAGRETPSSPLVLFYYGGGWTSGDRATYAFVGSALAANGVTTVVADYRLFPEVRFPAFCDDAALAYAWVHANVAGRGKRPIILMGHSAGAHIAALITLDPVYRRAVASDYPAPAALIGLSGPYGFDPTTWNSTKAIFATAPSADKVRPVALAKNGGPPVLLIHGGADTVVEPVAAHMFEEALKKAQTPVIKRIYPNIGHSALIMTFAQPLRWRAPLLGDVLSFVRSLPS